MDENTTPDPTVEESLRVLLGQVPAPIRSFVLNNLASKTGELMARYSIHVDQGGILERELLLMLLGQEQPADFVAELQTAGIAPDVVRSLINDINKEVFIPLREQEEQSGVAPAALPNLEKASPKTEWVPVNVAHSVSMSAPTAAPVMPVATPAAIMPTLPTPAISMPAPTPMQPKPTQSFGLPPANLPGALEFHASAPEPLPAIPPPTPLPAVSPFNPAPTPPVISSIPPSSPPTPVTTAFVPPVSVPTPPPIHVQQPAPPVSAPVQQAPIQIGFEPTKQAEPEVRTMAADMQMVKSGSYHPQEPSIPSFSTSPADVNPHLPPAIPAFAPPPPAPARPFPAPTISAQPAAPSAPRPTATPPSPTTSTTSTPATSTANENRDALHAVLKEYGVDPYREPIE
jgi:hypothetical protein